jgi:hypothetical protein
LFALVRVEVTEASDVVDTVAADEDLAAAWHPSQTYASVEECVHAHIAAHGGHADAVRKLVCPAPGAACAPGEPDLSALARVPYLKAADLSGRCIRDVTPIAALSQLKRLELAGNAITVIRPLGRLQKLVYLGLADNPVSADWLYSSREPFSTLPQLEALVLDGTTIDNILPLAHAQNLRVLSLRRMAFLDSLRPLAALPKLRVLHVDDAVVSDLRPLADMTRLEEFSADRTWVQSVAPLRRLVRRHRLRKVSLRGTCVHTCEALHGADYDCSAPRQEPCFVPEVEFMPHYSKFAVPVALVERFAAPDLPLWSSDELARGFEAARTAPHIDWRAGRGNCDGRLYATTALLRAQGFPGVGEVMSFGNLRMLASHDPLGFYMFDWHFAVVVRAPAGARTGLFVIDPALDETKPMRLRDWFARQVDSAGSPLDFACAPYWDLNAHLCNGSIMVDPHGDFLVDRLSSVLGTVCHDGICGR